jgi:undecaprenyl-diphosphatase
MALGLDRAAAAEFSFFLAMPTMMAAFVYSLLDEGLTIPPDRVLEIAVGFVMAFISALLVVRPFLGFVRHAGFVPFAWYRIGFGAVLLVGIVAAGWR